MCAQAFEKLLPYIEKGQAMENALTLFDWDNATIAPEEAGENTSKIIGILADQYFKAYNNEEVKGLLEELAKEEDSLSFQEKAVLRQLTRLLESIEHIPAKEYREFSQLQATGKRTWEKAKKKKDFSEFAPLLKKIVDYKKKFAGYQKEAGHQKECYDILLSDFEPGFNMEKLDLFFEKLKTELMPFVKEIVKKTQSVDKSYNGQEFDENKQKELSRFLAEYVGFDFNKGLMAESAHPFTTNLHNKDVRITNHFYKNNLESAIFSVIHETGHAIYEMQVRDELNLTPAGGGTSMAMHESQSRFFENVIGRSEAFWKPIFGKIEEAFPEQMKGITLEAFIQGINKPECTLIRTEADELTYPFHILIRYEIEKELFQGELKVEDIPKVWKEKYQQYLGVTPKDDSEGALQDVHWSDGSFGYFPSYALGSAIAAQIYYYMREKMPFESYLEEGNLTPIRTFLGEHIHQFGKGKDTEEILVDMMGEGFNPQYYIDYLKEKYTKIYG